MLSVGSPSVERVPLDQLRPHPRNYRVHPDDQLDHLIESIRAHSVYRNVVVARDGTILAGHGVVEALRKMGEASAPVIRLDLDPDEPRALKVLTGDNEIGHLVEADDRALSELLKEIKDADDLLGTGYDEAMLANLVMVTRPASEIRDFDAAAHWVGMPEYDAGSDRSTPRLVVQFLNEADREQFLTRIEVTTISRKDGPNWSCWWPPKSLDDLKSVRFEG